MKLVWLDNEYKLIVVLDHTKIASSKRALRHAFLLLATSAYDRKHLSNN